MNQKRAKYFKLAIIFLAIILSCQPAGKQDGKQNYGQLPFTSFRDVPGVTEEEIKAIETLKTKYGSFTCAINLNTDSFVDKYGEVSGFAIMFYDWLSGLFGIPFKPTLYEWNDFMSGIASGEIDFTIDLTDTPDRRRVYFMTSPITMRQVKIYRMADAEPLESIINRRKPRYAFPVGTTSVQSEVSEKAGYDFETIFVDSHSDSYPLLESGEIDGHIALDTAEAAFDEFGSVVSEDFFPLIFRSSGLLTRNSDLLPLISVMEKVLNDRTLAYLVEMRNAGYQEYMQNKLYTVLTEEERSYIKNNPVVPIAAEFNNYPVSFFDKNENQWEGIYFDAFREIAGLTGLKFECVNEPSVQYPGLIAMLENGSAFIVPELYRTKEHEGRFIWSEVPLLTDNYAFITRSDFRNIEISEIPYLHVGVHGNTPYCELFTQMFPNHSSHIIYDTQEETWDALKRGEVDVIFSSRRRLVTYTNYNEDAGFKLNLIFSNSFDTSFGFNKDAAVLRSIVDKALRFIKINSISDQWMNKGYDYRQKLAEAQRPLLLGSSIMLVFFLACVTFFLLRSRRTGRRLEKLVRQRTGELERETATLKAIFNSSTDYIFCKDLNLRYTRCNKSMAKVFGLSEAHILGKTDRDSLDFSEQTAAEFAAQDEQILNGKEFLIFEDQIVSKSDHSKVVFLETIKTPLIQNGKIVGIVGIARDITQRKEIERELEYHTSLLKTIVSSLPDLVFCKDLNFQYTLINKYMADLFHKEVDDILGKNDATALDLPDETVKIAHDTDLRVVNERQRVAYEEWLPSADGGTRLFETVKSPLILNGSVIGVLAIGRDITQHKEMEEELRAASHAKSAFLANMSHELRTPLNVVIGLTDLVLEETQLPGHVKDSLLKISNAGTTLLSIVNDILDFSKIESGRIELTPVEYHMSSLLNDVITLVSTRLGEKPIKFSLNISDDLPGRLYGDDLRVKQIFNNLLSNAIKYTHKGTIELSVSCKRDGADLLVEISVSDTGIGISEKNLKKLFSDYNQVDTRANRNIEGTGLGLAITKRLAELMGGEISVTSEHGKGSVFSVHFRQGFVSDTPIGPAVAENLRKFRYADDKRTTSKKLVRHDLSNARVMVVDDMQTNLDVAAGLLRKYKIQVDCITNGAEAVERIRSGSPAYNAVFMDHMMPGMDGIEAADAIRSIDSEYARKIPIIALTANAIQGTENMFYEHGFQAFISKPIDIMELDSVIKKWVRNELVEGPSIPNTTAHGASYNEDNNKPVINIPGVDTEKGLSLYGDDLDIYLPTLRSYVSYTMDVLDKLRNVSAESLPEYVINVHGLKGTSASIGAEIVRESALNLEKLARAGDLQGVLARNDRFIKGTENIVANIKAWLEKYDGENSDR
jgi:PAS domain S-box-containing protein